MDLANPSFSQSNVSTIYRRPTWLAKFGRIAQVKSTCSNAPPVLAAIGYRKAAAVDVDQAAPRLGPWTCSKMSTRGPQVAQHSVVGKFLLEGELAIGTTDRD